MINLLFYNKIKINKFNKKKLRNHINLLREHNYIHPVDFTYKNKEEKINIHKFTFFPLNKIHCHN